MTAVRPGTGLDEDAVVAVWQAAQAARGRRSGGTRTTRLRTRLRARDALLLVAEREGDAVGALLAELARDDDGRPVPGVLSLALLVVDPRAQRVGVGTALLDALTARYPRVTAWVPQDDVAAHGLCTSAGFVPSGRTREEPDGVHVHLRTPA